MVGSWNLWKIGNGQKVKICQDPWIDIKEKLQLSEDIIQALDEGGIFSLDPGPRR